MDKNLLAFVIGSSIISTFVTFLYNGVAFRRQRPYNVQIELMPIVVPIIFGLMNILLYNLIQRTTYNPFMLTIVVGSLTGIILSLIGRFYFDLPRNLYGIEREWTVHLVAVPLYAIIFGLIVYPLNRQLLLSV